MPCTKLITRFFLSTLSLRRATRCRPLCVAQYDFSIHALLAESDPCIPTGHSGALHFLSTLSLRRATQRTRSAARATFIFLSTLSLRRATARASTGHNLRSFFYPRSPCGERPILDFFLQSHIIFLSTLSLRRATILRKVGPALIRFSIHALLAESDFSHCRKSSMPSAFLSTLSLRRAT